MVLRLNHNCYVILTISDELLPFLIHLQTSVVLLQLLLLSIHRFLRLAVRPRFAFLLLVLEGVLLNFFLHVLEENTLLQGLLLFIHLHIRPIHG